MTHAPYSYRADPAVPAFDDSLPLLVFDGNCVLCSSGVNWMMQRDPQGTSQFAAIQQPLPQALYRHYGLNAARFDTFMVLKDGMAHTKWRGVLTAGKIMPAPWKWLGILGHIVPVFLGDAFYDWVQRNRIRWFGARDTCYVPTAAQKRRFISENA
jgi:predicted DCC family thiol-disulfide oxidoreductase YuxK